MRWRFFFFLSLAANVALALAWYSSTHRTKPHSEGTVEVVEGSAPTVKTNVVLRRQFFSWEEVESPDYPTYIANLREIGCPEQTIRDIIIADVNALYARRRATELLTPEQQWWRAEPDTNVVRAAVQKLREMEEERRGLLARLLGLDWESRDLVNLPRPTRPGVALDGPVLGVLPAETKQAVQDVSARSQERLQAYLDAERAAGRNPDPAELARLRQQTRAELAQVLSPGPLEEFLLRYSQNASDLRNELRTLRFFNATADEFRAMFRAQDLLDQQIALLSPADPNSLMQRRALEQQRDNAVRTALGANRYRDYQLLHDPLYRDAVAAAQQGGDPTAAQAIYEVSLAALQEQNRIRANTNLTTEQRMVEMKRAQLEQLKANAQALGQEIAPDPVPLPAPPPMRTHIVRSGDTVAVLSLQYGVGISAIRAANPDLDFSQVRPGDAIKIPESSLFLGR